jgi:hypothetical protein
LPEDEQTSKHGGGGRYNAILEFKRGADKKNLRKKEKMRKRKKEKEILKSIRMKKERENVSMSKNKISSPVL